MAALEVRLQPEHVAALDAASKPKLNFPADFIANGGSFGFGGTTINGQTFAPNPLAPRTDAERY